MNYDKIISDLSNILRTKHTVGIFVSGGFDSTVLSFTLHELREELKTNNVFKFFTVPRFEDSAIHAKRIVSYIDNHFKQRPSQHFCVGDPRVHHTEQVTSGLLDVFQLMKTSEQYKADVYVFCETRNPDDLPNGPLRKHPTHPLIYQPFINYTKDETVNIMIKRNLYQVMDITHTCTQSKKFRCQQCWQCRERAWAFSKHNIVDTGTM